MTDLRVRVLGSFEIEGFDVRMLRSRKTRTLLKVLALARSEPVSTDRLIECLWGDDAPRLPEREVSVHVSRARKLLGADCLPRVDAGYALRAGWLDLALVEELAAEARRRLRVGDHAGAHTAAVGGLALVRGPLLGDEVDAEWADSDRTASERLVGDLRRSAGEAALAVGDLGDATVFAEAALDQDPYDEAALRVVMEAHRRAGRPGSALAAYAAARQRLAEDLGTSPTAETERLHQDVLLDEASGETASRPRTNEFVDELPSASPIVLAGRAPELDRLDRAWQGAARQLELAVVEGEAGIGKSRLLDAWVERCRDAGGVVLRARCDELGRDLPLQPIADALSAHWHGASEGAVRDALGADAELLLPFVGRVATTVPAIPVQGDDLRLQVFAAFLRVLAAIGDPDTELPAVLVIDDVHLAGASTAAWLHFAVRRRSEAPLLVLTARRPEEGPDIPATMLTRIGALDLEAVRTIVGDDRAALLYERSRGHPLLLVELANSDDDVLPDSVLDSVTTRCERIGPAAATTLRAAAVLGPEIDLDLIATVLEASPFPLLEHLEMGVRFAFLEEQGARFVFRHELVREALAAGTSGSRRVLLHRLAAETLARRPDASTLDLAYHARLAALPDLAAEALARAGDMAARRYDFDEAMRLLDDSIELSDNGPARLARARVHLGRGSYDAARTDALAAQRLGVVAEALELQAWLARNTHHYEDAIALGEEGARLATDPRTRASCLLVSGWSRRGTGDLREAERVFTQLAQLEGEELGPLSAWLGMVYVNSGRPAAALRLLEPALEAETIVGHGFFIEHALQMMAHGYIQLGRSADALAMFERFDDELRRRGSEWRYRGLTTNYRSHVLRRLAAPEANDLSRAAIELDTITEVAVQARLDLADGHIGGDRLDEAVTLIDRADELTQTERFGNRWRCEHRVLLLRARVGLQAGNPTEAAERAHELVRLASARGERRYATFGRVAAAWAASSMGETIDVDAVATDLLALDEVAALESWWWTAQLARVAGVDAWFDDASRRVRMAAAGAGERAAVFLAHADRVLDNERR